MISVESSAGRLIEVRFEGALTPAEMKDMRTPLSEAVVRIGVDVIFIVDFRKCGALSSDVVPMMVGLMRSDNRRVHRSVHLFATGSTVAEQMKVAIADASNPKRRAFFSLAELIAWLGPAATADELERTQAFFA